MKSLLISRKTGRLRFAGECSSLSKPDAFAQTKRALHSKDWVVYVKQPFPGVRQLYRYLGRYTHRVGLSNERILSADERSVTFRTGGW